MYPAIVLFVQITKVDGTEVWTGSGSDIGDVFALESETGYIVYFKTDFSNTNSGFSLYYQPGSYGMCHFILLIYVSKTHLFHYAI